MRSALTGLDRATRRFWRVTGRPVDLAGEHAWLSAPTSTGPTVGGTWVEDAARAYGGKVVDPGGNGDPAGGLLADMALLDGSTFRARDLRPEVRGFDEQTSPWRMEVRARWAPLFRPGGAVVSRVFARRSSSPSRLRAARSPRRWAAGCASPCTTAATTPPVSLPRDLRGARRRERGAARRPHLGRVARDRGPASLPVDPGPNLTGPLRCGATTDDAGPAAPSAPPRGSAGEARPGPRATAAPSPRRRRARRPVGTRRRSRGAAGRRAPAR